jgi:hypothetical protein
VKLSLFYNLNFTKVYINFHAVPAVRTKLVRLATPVARKSNEGMVTPIVGPCRRLRLARFWSLVLGGRLCAGAFRRNLAPVAYVTPDFPCKEKLYTFRTFNAICKENVAIDGNTV